MLVNDSSYNHTNVGKIVMNGRWLSSAVLWLLPIMLNDGSPKRDREKWENLPGFHLFQTTPA